ncbi:SpoIIE family protein phosphatase [Streptomyces sp. NPDC005708]|uniref:SpoIIE family protein phosphatase n=1 Tax=Streptomyces sp. NPDC005708 TaxID=3154564 RepID=UPI003405D9B8
MTGPDGPQTTVAKALDALGAGAYLADAQGLIIAVNRRGEQLLARPLSALIGKDAHDLLHRTSYGQPVPRAQCRMRECVLAGRTEQGDGEWLERGDGTLLPVSWLATPCGVGLRLSATLVLFHSAGRSGQPAQRPPVTGRLSELERLALLAETTTLLTSNMLRAYARAQLEPPSKIVECLDQATGDIAEVSLATLVFARMTEKDDGQCELSWTNAGHPPPLLVTREGVARYLTEGHGLLLGVAPDQDRPDATTELPPGATLLLYTDGLVESPGHTLDEGLNRLRRHAASLAHRPLESFTDQLLARARPPDNEDDVALLAVRHVACSSTRHS